MRSVAEDVYYVSRDGRTMFGLNQLLAIPGLGEIELEAIDRMCGRSSDTMSWRVSSRPTAALRADGSIEDLPHGLYYIAPDCAVWRISDPGSRPDLDGPQMDFAIATVTSGRANLHRLRSELDRI
jgi:hypothetical protein